MVVLIFCLWKALSHFKMLKILNQVKNRLEITWYFESTLPKIPYDLKIKLCILYVKIDVFFSICAFQGTSSFNK